MYSSIALKIQENAKECPDKIAFIVNDETYDEQIVQGGQIVSEPENPSKDKYSFEGWSLNGVDIVVLSINYILYFL